MEHEDHDKPEYDMKMESLIPVLRREIPFKVHAHRADDMFTAIRIAKEFDIKLTLDHCTEGHLIADELAEEGYPVIVGPSLSERSKIELRNLTFETPGILSNEGLQVSLTDRSSSNTSTILTSMCRDSYKAWYEKRRCIRSNNYKSS